MLFSYFCIFLNKTFFCIPESFNTHNSIQLFYYKLTFVNSQHGKTISNGDFEHKNRFETFVLFISGIQNKSESKIIPNRFVVRSLQKHLNYIDFFLFKSIMI